MESILRYHDPPSWIACCTKARLDGHVIISRVVLQGFWVEKSRKMANDHCCVNSCTNKRNESGKNLSFFNFPSNKMQRSQWITAIKRDEGPLFQVSATSRDQRAVKCTSYTFSRYWRFFDLILSLAAFFIHKIISRNIFRENGVK